MIAVAALAVASCSKSDDVYDETRNRVTDAYNAAFTRYVGGHIDPLQDWGFGSVTRASVNVNGNEWETTPEVTANEASLVYNYVNMTRAQMRAANHNFTEVFPENLTAYYVTQVYTGEQSYNNLEGASCGKGSSHMDNLHIAENTAASINSNGALTGAWYHVNNFNAASNMNYGGNTLVTETGSCDFAYHCSEDSRYHNRWIAINGADVDASLAGKYYVCFDFEAINPNTKTVFEVSQPGNNPGEVFKDNVTVDGAWTVESAAAAGLQVVARGKTITITTDNAEVKQYQEGNKVVLPNDIYTDWIIRLVAAQPKSSDDIRVMVEDLSAAEDGDFDFNDVVFDVKFTSDTEADVTILAAGGTLPLTVDGQEVHGLFGQSTNVMINTNASSVAQRANEAAGKNIYGAIDGLTPVTIKVTGINKANKGNDIAVQVKKGDTWYDIEAKKGEPAAKFGCDPKVNYVGEQVSFKAVYNKFTEWVQDRTIQWY